MRRTDCSEFEKAVYAEAAIAPELQRHVESCERCTCLQEAVALSAPNLATDRADPFAQSVRAAATQMSRKRAEALERRRRAAPPLIGAAGYLVAIGGLVSTAIGHGSGTAAPALLPDLSFASLPAPDLLSIAAVLLGSTAAMVVVAVATRGRQLLPV
jgi:hypothetical protein